MKPEDKELLLKDISGRLLYGVKVTTVNPAVELGVISGISIENKISVRTKHADIVFDCTEVKPYLRSMLNITEEEAVELGKLIGKASYNMMHNVDFHDLYLLLEFIYKKHLDHNHLIEKGLALEAPNDMYKET